MLYHYAERGNPSHLSYGDIQMNAIGRPDLSQLNIFVRESIQNSWDARLFESENSNVHFSIDYAELSPHATSRLRDEIFGSGDLVPESILNSLKRERMPLLIVSDSGTVGLRGGTNAAVKSGVHNEFCSFVREVGRSSDKEIGGGTYGVGKGVFYQLSRCNTILVYSRTTDRYGLDVNRFIAISNQPGFEQGEVKFTGRHWWGDEEHHFDEFLDVNIPFADAVTGSRADSLASAFSMDLAFAEGGRYGTAIAVLDPNLGSLDECRPNEPDPVEEVMETFANAITRWVWPRLVKQIPGEPTLTVSVSCRGDALEVPDPHRDPFLKEYVRAYLASASVEPGVEEGLKLRRSSEVSAVRAKKADRHLGTFAIKEVSTENLGLEDHGKELVNRVALIRNPRMVIEYAALGLDTLGRNFVAVFVADSSVDALFARSEPTAHDTWNPKSMVLSERERLIWKGTNPVNVALSHIRTLIKAWGGDKETIENARLSLAARSISSNLGSVFAGQSGTGARRRPEKKTVNSRKRRGKLYSNVPHVSFVTIHPFGKRVVSEFLLDFDSVGSIGGRTYRVAPEVRTDQGWIEDAQDLSDFPQILGWRVLNAGSDSLSLAELNREGVFDGVLSITPELWTPKISVFVSQSRLHSVGLDAGISADKRSK